MQKELSLYKRSIQTGSWLPIPGIDSISYEIKITNLGDSFNEEWEEKYTYSSFNLCVGEDNSIWIGSIGLLFDWNKDEYVGDAMTYYTLDGIQLTKALKFPLEKGKYLVTIQRYKCKSEQKSTDSNSGFLFSFTKVETFESTNDPREDRYAFNQVNK